MSIFDDVRRLLGAKKRPGSGDIRAMIADAERRRDELQRLRAEHENGRAAAILAGDEQRAAFRTKLSDIDSEILDIVTVVDALGERLRDAERADADAERKRRYGEAVRVRDAATAAIAEKYPELARGLVDLIRRAAEADLLVQRANSDLPAGAERLLEAELAARLSPGLQRQVVGETVFEAWAPVGLDQPQPASAQIAARVETNKGDPDHGFVRIQDVPVGEARGPSSQYEPSRGNLVSVVNRFERRMFLRREILDSVAGERPLSLLALHLPGLVGGDADFWSPHLPVHQIEPASVLRRLDELEQRRREPPYRPAQTTRVEIVALPREAEKAFQSSLTALEAAP